MPPRASIAARCMLRRARRPCCLLPLPQAPPPSASRPPPYPAGLGPLRAGAPPLLRRTVVSPGLRGRAGGVQGLGLGVSSLPGMLPAARGGAPARRAGVAGAGVRGDRPAQGGPPPSQEPEASPLAAALPCRGNVYQFRSCCTARPSAAKLLSLGARVAWRPHTLHALDTTCGFHSKEVPFPLSLTYSGRTLLVRAGCAGRACMRPLAMYPLLPKRRLPSVMRARPAAAEK